MKKVAAFLLTLLMVVSLAACAGNSEPAETNFPDVESSVVDETSAPERSFRLNRKACSVKSAVVRAAVSKLV